MATAAESPSRFSQASRRIAAKHVVPQSSDEFDSERLGLQWQWEANEGADGDRSSRAPDSCACSRSHFLPAADLWSAAHC